MTFVNFLHPLFIPYGERSGLSGLWVQKTQHAHLSHFLFSESICLQNVHTHCSFGRGRQLPTFCQGLVGKFSSGWNIRQSMMASCLPCPPILYQLSSWHCNLHSYASCIQISAGSELKTGTGRGIILSPSWNPNAIKKTKHRDLWGSIRGKYNSDGGGCGMKN